MIVFISRVSAMTKIPRIAMSSSQSPLIKKISANPLLQEEISPSGSAPRSSGVVLGLVLAASSWFLVCTEMDNHQ